jgi:putative ABC transport system substrate-binding protein
MKRREFVALVVSAAAWPFAVRAQQTGLLPRIGFLYPGATGVAGTRIAALREGLRVIGYREADQVEALMRCAEGNPAQLPPLAVDLVARRVDVIVAASQSAVRAAKSATAVIPIIAVDLESDPVASGFVANLAHPSGNMTGVFSDFPEFGMKWLELIKDALPALLSAVVLWDPATGPTQLNAVETAGRLLNVKLKVAEIRGIGELEGVFATVAEGRPDAMVILSSPVFGTRPELVAQLALAYHIPTVTLFSDIARAGGLLAYGPNLLGSFRQAGTLVGKILQGLLPADLAVERPIKFELVINLKAAKALSLEIPPMLLARADEVIE